MKTQAIENRSYRKSLLLALMLVALLMLLQSCSSDEQELLTPEASFSATIDEDNPLMVIFENNSEHAESYLWSFGDGNTSTQKDPVHVYEAGDLYDVELQAISGVGSSSFSSIVDVDEPTAPIEFDYYTWMPSAEVEVSTISYYDDGSADLTLKLFNVRNSTDDRRPMILLAPGGSWEKYNRVGELETMSRNLAGRGYVVAVIEYTIGSMNPDVFVQSLLDFKTAIKYCKKYAGELRIDPDKIFTGGWSSGSQLAMYAAHLSQQDLDGFQQEILLQVIGGAVAQFGFNSSMYPEYDSEVRGNLLMMPYAWNETIFQESGPAVMMIANQNSIFSDGTEIWGEDFIQGGVSFVGPDIMYQDLLSLGYVSGEDLEFLVTDPSLEDMVSHINYTSLHHSHYDEIADFFKRNL